MWAHYADQSQGICIRYDTKELELTPNDTGATLVKIAYKKEPAFIRQFSDEAIIKVLSQKSRKWASEKEWRVLFNAPLDHAPEAGHPLPIGKALSRVYIGCRVKEEHVRRIVSTVQSLNPLASFYKMNIEGYTMYFSPLS